MHPCPPDPSPIQAFLDWYRGTPQEIRDHLAFFFGGLAPGDTLAGESSLRPLKFEELCDRILTLAGRHPVRVAGVAIMLRGFVDFTFMGRTTNEDWEKARAQNLAIADIAEGQGSESLPGTLRDSDKRFPLRGRQWVREADRWAELKQSALSDDGIDEWLKNTLRRGGL